MEITNELLGVITAIATGVPDTAATNAEAARDRAEAAATMAQEHSMGFNFSSGVLTLTPITEEDD